MEYDIEQALKEAKEKGLTTYIQFGYVREVVSDGDDYYLYPGE